MKNKFKIVLSFMIVLSVMLQGIFIPAHAAGLNAYDSNNTGLYDDASDNNKSKAAFGKDARGVKGVQTKSWVVYKDMDFGEVGPYKVELEARIPEGYNPENVEIRLDDPNAAPIAVVSIAPNDAWTGPMTVNEAWITKTITGKHDVYIYVPTKTLNAGNLTFYEKLTDQFKYEKYVQGAGFTDVADEDLKRTLDKLTGLGIIDIPEDGLCRGSLLVTRAEFAQSVYRMFVEKPNEEEMQQEGETEAVVSTPFDDVASDSAYAEAIKYLSENGIMNGSSETEFKPDSFIPYIDAVTVMVRILGFKPLAEAAGGYPNGYINMATREKLVSGSTKFDEFITRENMLFLLESTLEAEYLDADTFTADGYTHFKRKDGILSLTQKTYMGSGKVEGTPLTYLNMPNSELEFNEVIIGGNQYYVGDTNVSAMIGMDVDFFYQDIEGDKTLRAVVPKDTTEIIELASSADTISAISNSEIVYTMAGEDDEETFEINADVSVIYNGVAAHTKLEGMLDNKDAFKGFISIAENRDGSAVVMIDEYIDIEVESIDAAAQAVKARKVSGETNNIIIDLNTGENYVIMKDEIGEDVKIEQLKSGDILTVYQSKNDGKKLVRVYPALAPIEGTIDKIDHEGNVYINGEKYIFSNRYDGVIEVGMQRKFYLNAYGDVFKAESLAGIPQVGLYWGCSYTDDGFEQSGEIKIMTTSAKTQIFKLAKKVTVDGAELDAAKAVVKGNGAGWSGLESIALETPIRYTVNSEGAVKMIDTPITVAPGTKVLSSEIADDPNNTLIKLPNADYNNLFHYSKAGSFLITREKASGTDAMTPTYYCPSTALGFAFYVPLADSNKNPITDLGSTEREKSCIAGSISSVIGSGYAANTAYSTTANLKVADLVIDDSKQSDYEADQPVVVEKVTTEIDADGELVYNLEGYSTTGKVEYLLSDDFLNQQYGAKKIDDKGVVIQYPIKNSEIFIGDNGLKAGDIIKLRASSKNAKSIDSITLYAYGETGRTYKTIGDIDRDLSPTVSISKREYSSGVKLEPGYRYGTVLERNDKYMVINAGTDENPEEHLIPIESALVIEVYKTERGEFIKNSVGASAIEKGDEVFVHMYSGAVKMIVIYDDGVK